MPARKGRVDPWTPPTVPGLRGMPAPNLRLSTDPKTPTAVGPKPADHPPAGADPEVAGEAAAAVREDQAAWEVPAGGRA